ncbi:hypothetical protein LUZ60_000047 [Juncus effusus]|nr:hypothetical protein LUZ60_000047 [Juncus effusus]
MDSAVRAQSSWAGLQPDLLASIGNLLDAVSCLRCSAVCTSWAAALRPDLPPVRLDQPLPWLLLSAQNLESNPTNTTFAFYDVVTRKSCRIPIRALQGQRWLGSNDGWLVTVDLLCNLCLIKPLFGETLTLPSVTTIPLWRGLLPGNYDSDGNIDGFCGMDLKKFSRSFFKKVIICRTPDSESGFLVVGMFARFHLAVVKFGEKKWTLLDDLKRVYHDVIVFDGKLYAITGNSLHCWDFEGSSFGPRKKVCNIDRRLYIWSKYLVELRGELLMVCRNGEFLQSTVQNYKTVDVKVYKFNQNPDSAPQRVSFTLVDKLDDVAIFVGTSYSKAVPTVGIDGIKGNCVYFTDDSWWSFINPNGPNFIRDLGVFDLGEETYEPFYPKESLVNWPPPTWFWPC